MTNSELTFNLTLLDKMLLWIDVGDKSSLEALGNEDFINGGELSFLKENHSEL